MARFRISALGGVRAEARSPVRLKLALDHGLDNGWGEWEPQAPAASFVSRWKSGRFGLASGLVCPPAAPANPTSRPLLKFTTGPAQLFQARFEPLPVCPVASLQVGQEVLLGRLRP